MKSQVTFPVCVSNTAFRYNTAWGKGATAKLS